MKAILMLKKYTPITRELYDKIREVELATSWEVSEGIWDGIALNRLKVDLENAATRIAFPSIDEEHSWEEIFEFYHPEDCIQARNALELAEVRMRADKHLSAKVRELYRAHEKELEELVED